MNYAGLALNTYLLGLGLDDVIEFLAWLDGVVLAATLYKSVGRLAHGYLGKSDIHHLEPVAIATSRTDADNVLYTIELVELHRVNANAGHTHATGHN